jgi:hypothetical protein
VLIVYYIFHVKVVDQFGLEWPEPWSKVGTMASQNDQNQFNLKYNFGVFPNTNKQLAWLVSLLVSCVCGPEFEPGLDHIFI